MGRQERTSKTHPWPVRALITMSAVGSIWSVIADGDRSLMDVAMLPLGVWITYSLWAGKRWAFTVLFMLASLCAGLLATIALVQVFPTGPGSRRRGAVGAAWLCRMDRITDASSHETVRGLR
jgi:hypothetical protein